MERLKKFIRTTLLGGLGVILPILIIVYLIYWLVNLIAGLVEPLADIVFNRTPVEGFVAILLTLAGIIVLCFLVGLAVKSTYGRFLHRLVEDQFLKKIPGYGVVTDTVRYFTDSTLTPFSKVALIRPFGNETMMTGFITDQHKDNYTVFIPTGPNPTSGNIMHINKEFVTIIDVKIEDAMQSIIGGGAGSSRILKSKKKKS